MVSLSWPPVQFGRLCKEPNMANTGFTVYIFSARGVSGVRNFKCVSSVRFFVLCLWSDQYEFMAVFMVLIFGLFQALFFFSLVVFLIFLQIFSFYYPWTWPALKRISQAECSYGTQWLKIPRSKGPLGLLLLYLKMEAQPASETSCFFNFKCSINSKKRKFCQWHTAEFDAL